MNGQPFYQSCQRVFAIDANKPTLVKNPIYERYRWQTFAVTWLAYAGFYLTRKSFSVAKIGMGEGTEVGLSSEQMSYIDGSYLIAYAVGQFIAGMCGDRFGTRRVILLGMFCSVFAAIAMGVSTSVVMLGVFFCIQGLCQSSGWAPLIKNVGQFFSQRERGKIMGIWCTNYAAGGVIATLFAGWAGQKFGYQYAFFAPAIALAGVWILFILFQRNSPEDVGLPHIEEYHREPESVLEANESFQQETEGSWKIIKDVYLNPTVLMLATAYFCLKPTRYAILFWGPKYMNEKLGTDMIGSGFLSVLFEVGGILSVFLGGWISDRVFDSRRMPVCVICLG
ncbi:MAG: MFS transporter, partial [Candidatus Hydrogenedentota bacterium]